MTDKEILVREIQNLKDNIFSECQDCLYSNDRSAIIFKKAVSVARNMLCYATQIFHGYHPICETYEELTLQDCKQILDDVYHIMLENDFAPNKELKIQKVIAHKFVNPSELLFF